MGQTAGKEIYAAPSRICAQYGCLDGQMYGRRSLVAAYATSVPGTAYCACRLIPVQLPEYAQTARSSLVVLVAAYTSSVVGQLEVSEHRWVPAKRYVSNGHGVAGP
eukprot:330285-Rhodomonas_salina.1